MYCLRQRHIVYTDQAFSEPAEYATSGIYGIKKNKNKNCSNHAPDILLVHRCIVLNRQHMYLNIKGKQLQYQKDRANKVFLVRAEYC